MGSVLFYAATISCAFGIAVRSFYHADLVMVVWLLCVSLALALIYHKHHASTHAYLVLCASVCVLCFSLGVLRMQYAQHESISAYLHAHVDTNVTLVGVIDQEIQRSDTAAHVYVHTQYGRIRVSGDRFANVAYGDRVRVQGELVVPTAFQTDMGRTFNYLGYLQARGVSYEVRYAKIYSLAPDNGNVIRTNLLRVKHTLMQHIESTIPEPQAALAEGLLLGVKKAMSDNLQSAFRATGVIHIVVLSGYNVMLVITFIMYVLSLILPFRMRLFVGGLGVVCFALMVGLSPTVMRASIMALLLYQIGQFSVVAFVVNILVLPMVPVAMLLTFISALCGFFSHTLALSTAFFANLSLLYILDTVRTFAALPFASYVVPPFPFYILVTTYVLYAAALVYARYRPVLFVHDPYHDWIIEDEESLRAKLRTRS